MSRVYIQKDLEGESVQLHRNFCAGKLKNPRKLGLFEIGEIF